jgi:hypothetical protein
MDRKDVKAARDLAAAFVKASDELLAAQYESWDYKTGNRTAEAWKYTGLIAGKQTGAHRRLSLDLTRALAHMRRRFR